MALPSPIFVLICPLHLDSEYKEKRFSKGNASAQDQSKERQTKIKTKLKKSFKITKTFSLLQMLRKN